MNLFYRKPRSFATTRRHSFSATDGCTSPSVRLSPSAVCLSGIAFRELRIFKKRLPRSRKVSLFSLAFRPLPALFRAQSRIPGVPSVFLHFHTFRSRFRRIAPAGSCFTPHAPFRSVEIGKRFACESLSPFQKTIFRPILKHFRHAFSNRFFRNLNSPYTGDPFEKGNPVGRKPMFCAYFKLQDYYSSKIMG